MKQLRVLMFGWEFPPFKSGGLGTACYGLTKGLDARGVKTTFVMPVAPEGAKAKFVKLVAASGITRNVKFKTITSPITAYMTYSGYEHHISTTITSSKKKSVYGRDLFEEVQRYTALAAPIAKEEEHDIIHAHDWMTYHAALNAKRISRKPLVVHLHATEFDRTGGKPDGRISHIEYVGLSQADKVITNSEFSKRNIIKHYGIAPSKIDVVHWGIDDEEVQTQHSEIPLAKENLVLFLGRVTIQKGPDYFIEAAKSVLAYEPSARFVIVGDGDMLPRVINRAAELGIADRVTFTGALSGADVHRAFRSAKVYVMPSVSEPFGLVALESVRNKTPVIISRQSGVSEVLKHSLKIDFWDVNELTNKIVNVLRHSALQSELRENGFNESKRFTLDTPAQKVIAIYNSLLGRKP